MIKEIKPILALELGAKGGHLEFEQPSEVQQWLASELDKWQWMQQVPQVRNALETFRMVQNESNQYIQQWVLSQNKPDAGLEQLNSLKSSLESAINRQSLWLSSSPTGAFLLQLNQDQVRGPLVAAGAYLALGGSFSPTNEPVHPKLFEGAVEGFLYKREIDWTATAHREALEKLKQEYSQNLADQKRKNISIEKKNTELNTQFHEVLNGNVISLENLHKSQAEEFKKLIETHEANLKAIENAYDQKLALWKPVEYWEARGRSHNAKTTKFAIASGVTGVVILIALGWLAYEIFLNVPPNEKPQVWQVGVFSVAAFFGIWLERILVRLFVSNIHLATDAEERVTMLQTYLSIIREGSEFAPEDKKLILERLFHPAADGLVKDDGAPPSPLEMLTRR